MNSEISSSVVSSTIYTIAPSALFLLQVVLLFYEVNIPIYMKTQDIFFRERLICAQSLIFSLIFKNKDAPQILASVEGSIHAGSFREFRNKRLHDGSSIHTLYFNSYVGRWTMLLVSGRKRFLRLDKDYL